MRWTFSDQKRAYGKPAGKITAAEIRNLPPGAPVVVKGIIQSSDPLFNGQMQDGCIVDIHTKTGEAEPTNAYVRYEAQLHKGAIDLVWNNECPEGNLVLTEPPDDPQRAWLGYAEGTEIRCEGKRSEDDPSSIEVTNQDCLDGEELAEFQEFRRQDPSLFPYTGAAVLAWLYFFVSLSSFWTLFRTSPQRRRWTKLAKKKGWIYQSNRTGPGSIRVLTEISDLEVHQMERIGLDNPDKNHIEIHCILPEYLAPPKVQQLLESTRPRPDSPLHLRIRRTGLHDRIQAFSKQPHRLEYPGTHTNRTLNRNPPSAITGPVNPRKNKVVWVRKGTGDRQIQDAVKQCGDLFDALHSAALAELRQLALDRNWTLELGPHIQASTPDGHRIFTVDCNRVPPRTCLEVALPDDAPAGLRIQAREVQPSGIQTFDPILDKLISMSAHDTSQLRKLVTRPGFTEAALDLIKGHGGEVVDGRIHVKQNAIMLEPTKALHAMEALLGCLTESRSQREL